MGLSCLLAKRSILLLQGPVGPFFKLLGEALEQRGARVTQIVFNGADAYFGHSNQLQYAGSVSNFNPYLRGLLDEEHFDCVVLFGDCRIYHRIASELCKEKGLEVLVFEEGYLRPHWVTLEKSGVNGRSLLVPELRDLTPSESPTKVETDFNLSVSKLKGSLISLVAYTHFMHYAFQVHRHRKEYPLYEHHRPISLGYQFNALVNWSCRNLKDLVFAQSQKIGRWAKDNDGRYYLVALQVQTDSQLKFGSQFESNQDFLTHLLTKYSQYVARCLQTSVRPARLLIKQHPLDVGFESYRTFIQEQCQELGLGVDLVKYCRRANLPHLLRCCKGLITINSTTAISAFVHRKPAIALGSAVYSQSKLIFKGTLDEFLIDPGVIPSDQDVQAFRQYLVQTCQIPGSFYSRSLIPIKPGTVSSRQGLAGRTEPSFQVEPAENF